MICSAYLYEALVGHLRETSAARAILTRGEEEEAAPDHVRKVEKHETEPADTHVASV